MTHLIRVTIAATLLVSAATPSLAQASFEASVLRALDEYVAATNSGDPGAVAAMYLESPTTATVGDGAIHRGTSSVAELLREIYRDSGSVRLAISDVGITPTGSDAATVYFAAEWTFGAASRPPVRGAMTIVFVRTDAGWKVAHDHTSTLAGIAAPAPRQTREATGGPPGPVRAADSCAVTRIVDGDTIDCDPFGRVRLIGMDTPERDQAPFGALATEALSSLIPEGTTVELELDVERNDRYGRVLGYIWHEGDLVNWLMVRTGYAVLLTYPPNVQYVDWLRQAQTEARDDAAGLWAIDGFACEPQAHRRSEC